MTVEMEPQEAEEAEVVENVENVENVGEVGFTSDKKTEAGSVAKDLGPLPSSGPGGKLDGGIGDGRPFRPRIAPPSAPEQSHPRMQPVATQRGSSHP